MSTPPTPSTTRTDNSTKSSRARGRAIRDGLPRRSHGALRLPEDRDPVALLESQHASRLQELVPVRIGRMLQSPFAYYRGTAGQMAADLRDDATVGARVVACGDAHISNFGFYASPERTLLFDLNDFDEGGIAPFEWDVKRLAASVHIGGRDGGLSEQQCRDATEGAVAAYQRALREFADLTALERFYYQIDVRALEKTLRDPDDLAASRRNVKKARRRTADQVLAKITTRSTDGVLRIVDEPPVTRHVDHASLDELRQAFDDYRGTVRDDIRALLEQFEVVDFVLRVVGVGSVGTRCYLIGLSGPSGEPLFLQAKEVQESVLVAQGGMPAVLPADPRLVVASQGQRVVSAQRILQAQSDSFLGWFVGWAGEQSDRPRVDYYWRQFRDMKGSVDLAALRPKSFTTYAAVCARLLARAHSQSPASQTVRGYLGRDGGFAPAVADWAAAYADVCESDFRALEHAAAQGRVPVERGV